MQFVWCRCRKHYENSASSSGATTKCASTVQASVPCVHAPKHWALFHGLFILIQRPRTPTMACFVTSVLAGTTFTSSAWSSQMQLFTSTRSGCITGYYGLGLAVHWTRSVWHHLEPRQVVFPWMNYADYLALLWTECIWALLMLFCMAGVYMKVAAALKMTWLGYIWKLGLHSILMWNIQKCLRGSVWLLVQQNFVNTDSHNTDPCMDFLITQTPFLAHRVPEYTGGWWIFQAGHLTWRALV